MSPNGGSNDPFMNLRERTQDLERNERSEISNAVIKLLFADLPVADQAGRLRFVTDGRKMGEGPGAGTGVPVYDDGTSTGWRRMSDDTVVLN